MCCAVVPLYASLRSQSLTRAVVVIELGSAPPRALQISCIVRDMRLDAEHRVDQGVILAENLTVNDIRDSFWDRSICSELVLHYRLDRRWSTSM